MERRCRMIGDGEARCGGPVAVSATKRRRQALSPKISFHARSWKHLPWRLRRETDDILSRCSAMRAGRDRCRAASQRHRRDDGRSRIRRTVCPRKPRARDAASRPATQRECSVGRFSRSANVYAHPWATAHWNGRCPERCDQRQQRSRPLATGDSDHGRHLRRCGIPDRRVREVAPRRQLPLQARGPRIPRNPFRGRNAGSHELQRNESGPRAARRCRRFPRTAC